MNLEQAQCLRKKLLYLEGLIAWNTREYIWRVAVGPKDRLLLDRFRDMVDPSIPFNPRALLQPFRREDLSVYFFLKLNGHLLCQDYREFLAANNVQVGDSGYVLVPFLQ